MKDAEFNDRIAEIDRYLVLLRVILKLAKKHRHPADLQQAWDLSLDIKTKIGVLLSETKSVQI